MSDDGSIDLDSEKDALQALIWHGSEPLDPRAIHRPDPTDRPGGRFA